MDPAIVAFGLGIGVLVGMTGMGGASLMTPLLILVFNITPVTAIGTDIFYAAITKTVGGYQHLKLKTVHLGIAFWMAVGSVPSALLGVWVIEILQREYGEERLEELVLGMLGGALLVVGFATLLRTLFFKDVIVERSAMHLYRRHIIAAIITGVVTGFVIGLTSAGSGTLIAIALIAIFRLTPQRVVGTDVFHAAVLLWAAGAAHWIGGNIDFVPRREHPARVRAGSHHRHQAVGQGSAGIPQGRPRRGPDRVRHHARDQGGRGRRGSRAGRRQLDDRPPYRPPARSAQPQQQRPGRRPRPDRVTLGRWPRSSTTQPQRLTGS